MTETIAPAHDLFSSPKMPKPSYFALNRRAAYAASPGTGTPGSMPTTPGEDDIRLMKGFNFEPQQLKRSLFNLKSLPRTRGFKERPGKVVPNLTWNNYEIQKSRPRQFSAASDMTIAPDPEIQGRDRFGSVDTLYDTEYVSDKDKNFTKRTSIASITKEIDNSSYALPRKHSIMGERIEEEDVTVIETPTLSYDSSPPQAIEIEEELRESAVDELDELDGEAPYVPPAFEVIDPAIPIAEPDVASITTNEPQAPHPWKFPPFSVVDRPKPTIHKARATVKITLSLSVVISLLVGYGLKLKIVKFGRFSFGMYGLLLVIDFIVQTIAASFNRRRVVKITRESFITKGVQKLKEKAAAAATGQSVGTAPDEDKLPEVSIAVVGYREDEEAWISCLKSLQAQEYPIKHIIGVVDGNDGPDMDMANAFGKAFPEDQRLIVHLPVLLSVMYKEKYWETIKTLNYPKLTRTEYLKMWFTQKSRPGQETAHEVAWDHILDYLHTKAVEGRWADYKAICFSQPHGHKRHAMFTSFVVGAYALGTKDAMLTTDSDTYVHPDAVSNLMSLLFSDVRIAGVTGEVRIWNKKESFLALMSSLRYWFAFNVERACQSAFGAVGCLSGPLGLYRTNDLMSVLGPWILQSFLGKETTFGDDRHLSNRILSLGHKTGYTHLALCDSDTPAGYVRWVKQQTRWSKSFFREAFWFPKGFAYHDFWLTVETTKQFLYPMVLTATVLQMLYRPSDWIRPVIWLSTMFGVAVIKSVYGVVCMRDPTHFLFGIYGFMYFFGLLPSKLFACFTVGITTWGTSARSKSEFKRPESFYSRTTHIGHLVAWYLALSVGLGYFLTSVLGGSILWAVSLIGLPPVLHAYSDVIIGETQYYWFVFRKWRRDRRSNPVDAEKAGAASAYNGSVSTISETQSSSVEVHDEVAPHVTVVGPDAEQNPFADPVTIIEKPIFTRPFGSVGGMSIASTDTLPSGPHRPSDATVFSGMHRPSDATLLDDSSKFSIASSEGAGDDSGNHKHFSPTLNISAYPPSAMKLLRRDSIAQEKYLAKEIAQFQSQRFTMKKLAPEVDAGTGIEEVPRNIEVS